MPMVSASALTLDLETGNGCELTSTEDVTSLLLAQSSGGRKRRLGSPGSQAGRHGLPHTGLAEPGAPGRRTPPLATPAANALDSYTSVTGMAAHVGRLSRREGLQLMLGAARAVPLAATGCQVRRSPAPYGGVARSDRPPTISRFDSYTPFPFITTSNPPLDHTGVAQRPGYSASDPRSAAVVDPMSGTEIFRVGGNFGATLFINGTTNSGLVLPSCLRTENTKNAQNVWNTDGTLLMVNRRFRSTGDPGNSASCYIIDVDGTHGASAPWRIIRASSSISFGDGPGAVWFWDPLNPLRAYAIQDDGNVQEWWPIGGGGNPVGKVNTLFHVSGVNNAGSAHRTGLNTSYDGRYCMMACRRNSDGAWGGYRLDLIAETVASGFIQTPLQSNDDNDRAAIGISPLGNYTIFNTNLGGTYNRLQVKHISTNQVTAIVPNADSFSHTDFCVVNGVEYLAGHHSNSTGFRLMRCSGPVNQTDADLLVKATPQFLAGGNPQHTTCRAYKDLMETAGAVGGSSTGTRYAFWARSGPSNGQERGIFGIRLGQNDQNVVRYLCNHRSVRTSNRNEVHPHISPTAEYLAFSSNWESPGIETGNVVNPCVAVIPDAWSSPNNDGS
jgi:hypothetical protein